MPEKLDRNLNLVIPLYDAADKPYAHVHVMPLGQEAFDRYADVLAATFDRLAEIGLRSSPRVAASVLRKVAERLGEWENAKDQDGKMIPGSGVKDGLLLELRRLTNVALPGVRGWETMPWDDALKANRIQPDDVAEVSNASAFFIVASRMVRRSAATRDLMMKAYDQLWGAHCSLSSVTDMSAGLPTLTPDGATVTPLRSLPQ